MIGGDAKLYLGYVVPEDLFLGAGMILVMENIKRRQMAED